MTPEKLGALDEHIRAIAMILHEDTPPEELNNLAAIEQTVRNQVQKHVAPKIGFFYRNRDWNNRRISQNHKTYHWRIVIVTKFSPTKNLLFGTLARKGLQNRSYKIANISSVN